MGLSQGIGEGVVPRVSFWLSFFVCTRLLVPKCKMLHTITPVFGN
jgi:hypothetical protein